VDQALRSRRPHSSSSSVHRGRSGRGGREGGSAIQGTVGVESASPLRDNIMLRCNEGRGEGGSGSGDKKRDRHSNDDRHKDRKGDWHKKNENNQRVHKDNEGNTIVDKSCGHRCICGYKTCPKLWEEYSGTGHVYDRANIRLEKSDNPLWLPFQESLLRNLHVSEEMGEAIITAPKGYRFSVAPYHFTEKVVAKYWSNPAVRGAWKQRFTRQEAEGLLHLPLDERDKDKDVGKYFVNANNPIVGAAQKLLTIKSDRGKRLQERSSTDSGDSEKKALRASLERKNTKLAKHEAELRRCYEIIEELTRENHVIKQKNRRWGGKMGSLSAENEDLREKVEKSMSLEDVMKILREVGGISRLTIFDMKWHKKHPKACMCLWGIQDFEELLVLIECLFPDVDITKLPKLETKRKSKRRKKSPNMGLPVLSDIEVSMVVVVN